jgi:hypothetical protein
VQHVIWIGRDKKRNTKFKLINVSLHSKEMGQHLYEFFWHMYVDFVMLCIRGLTEMLLSVWDIRKSNPIWSLKEMDDHVSCMVTTEAQRYLVCTSGEGTVTSIDLRNGKLHLQARF